VTLFRLITTCIITLCTTVTLYASIGEWKTYTSKRAIRDITVSNGFIWAATSGGAFIFNSLDSTFKEFTTSEGLRSNTLTSLVETEDGNFFFGSSNGVIQMYSPRSKTWRYDEEIKSRAVNSRINRLRIYGDTLIICSELGVSLFSVSRFRFDGSTYENFGLGNQLKGKARDVVYANGNIFVATENGIAMAAANSINLRDPSMWQVFTNVHGLPSGTVNALSSFKGNVFASTENGIASWNGSSWVTKNGTLGSSFLNFFESRDSLYAFTENSLYKFITEDSLVVVQTFSGFRVTSMGGVNGQFVFGTTEKGIQTNEKNYFPEGPSTNHFFNLTVDANGTLWAATTYDAGSEGLLRYDGFTWRTLIHDNFNDNGTPSYRVNVGSNNTIWLSTWFKGIGVLNSDGALLKVFNDSSTLPSTTNHPNCQPFPFSSSIPLGAVVDRFETTWVASRTPVVKTVIGGRDTAIVGKKILVAFYNNQEVRSIDLFDEDCHKFTGATIDHLGTIWFTNVNFKETTPVSSGDDDNLFFFNPKRRIQGAGANGWGKVTKGDDGLLSVAIHSVTVDLNGDIWVGTDEGINIIFDAANPKRSVAFYAPLTGAKITAIAVDALNNKWVATPQGVYYLSSDGTSILEKYTVENTGGKLIANDVKSVAVDGKSGTVYFGTDDGLSSLKISAVTPRETFSELVFVPNPFSVPNAKPLEIRGLVKNSIIKILSVDGMLVRQLDVSSSQSPGGGIALWDGKDKIGNLASSGVYFVVASDEQGNKVAVGKLAVIRK